MKILKYLFFLILILAIGLGIYTLIQPSEYNFSRTRLMDASDKLIYQQVDDYKKWEDWGPWKEQDPTIIATYDTKTKGPGASYSWSGADGVGKAKRIETVPHESLMDELDFGSMGKATTYWSFKNKDGKTEVSWGMKAKDIPYAMKFFGAISGGYENMMGPMFERGLEKLDSVSRIRHQEDMALLNSWKLSEIKEISEESQRFLGYAYSSRIDLEAIQKIYGAALPKAMKYAQEQGLKETDYSPGAVFKKWDEERGETDFIVGIFVNQWIRPATGMQWNTIPRGKKITISKFGKYGTGEKEAYELLDAYIEENQLIMNGSNYEIFMNEPSKVKPNEIQTDIYYPVK